MKLNIPEKMQNILDKHGYELCDPDTISKYCLVTLQTTLSTGDIFSKRLSSYNGISSLLQSIFDFCRETDDNRLSKMIAESMAQSRPSDKLIQENTAYVKKTLNALIKDLIENCPRVDQYMRELPIITLK